MHTFKVSGIGGGSCVAKITAAIHAPIPTHLSALHYHKVRYELSHL